MTSSNRRTDSSTNSHPGFAQAIGSDTTPAGSETLTGLAIDRECRESDYASSGCRVGFRWPDSEEVAPEKTVAVVVPRRAGVPD